MVTQSPMGTDHFIFMNSSDRSRRNVTTLFLQYEVKFILVVQICYLIALVIVEIRGAERVQ